MADEVISIEERAVRALERAADALQLLSQIFDNACYQHKGGGRTFSVEVESVGGVVVVENDPA